jgi:hypothetical protein
MRVFRVLMGMVLLTVAASALLAGAFSWHAMQHRDDAGRFSVRFETVAHPGYAVVVPDVDGVYERPADEAIWLSSGVVPVDTEPADWRGKPVARVVMAPDGTKVDGVALAAAVVFAWLDYTTWGLILGPVLVLLGLIGLAWPLRKLGYITAAPPDSARLARSAATWMDLPTLEIAMLRPEFTPADAPAAPSPLTTGPPAAATVGAVEESRKPEDKDPPRPDPSLEWPLLDVPQPTPDPVEIPTREAVILGDLPHVPLQLNGVGPNVMASGPAGGGGSTLTGGTV